jgi:hypothetical protein
MVKILGGFFFSSIFFAATVPENWQIGTQPYLIREHWSVKACSALSIIFFFDGKNEMFPEIK